MESEHNSLEWTETVRKIRYVWTVTLHDRFELCLKSRSFPYHSAEKDQWFLGVNTYPVLKEGKIRLDVVGRQGTSSNTQWDIRYVSGFFDVEVIDPGNGRHRKIEQSDSFDYFIITFEDIRYPNGPFTITCTIAENLAKPDVCMKDMLASNGLIADVVVRTKDKDIPCHELFLAKSPVFQKTLQVDMKEKEAKVIDLSDVVDTETAEDLIHFLYDGTAPNIATTCGKLFPMADLHSLDKLKDQCQFQMEKKLVIENVADICNWPLRTRGPFSRNTVSC